MNKIFSFRTLTTIVVTGAVCAPAVTAEVSATCGVASSYTGNADALIYDDDTSYTCSLDYSSINAWYAGIWVAEDGDGVDDFGNEVDFYFGADTSFWGLDANFELAYYALFGADAINPSVTISKSIARFTPYMTLNTYFPVQSDGFESGNIYFAGVETSVYNRGALSLSLDTGVIYDDGPFGNPKGTSASFGFLASYEATNSLHFNFEARQFSSISADKPNNSYVGMSATQVF